MRLTSARRAVKAAMSGLVALGLLAGCLPIPNIQTDLSVAPPHYRVPLGEIRPRYVIVDGAPAPWTPNEHDRSAYLRYSLDEQPEMIVLMMPGLFGGAASFDGLARQLVAATPGLEVWSIDRRSNLLEDRSAFRGSLLRGDPWHAYEYYLVRRGQDDGFKLPSHDDLGFMRYWGLDVHLRDLHLLVREARERAPFVVLAGHSLGASLVSLYAAYQVEDHGEPRFGQEFIDALILLDGGLGRTGAFEWEDVGVGLGPLRLTPSVEQLEAGRGEVYSDSLISPYYQIEREVIAHFARLLPDEEAPPLLSDFPITNLALAGVRNDDQYGAVPVFSASLGEAVGAEFAGNIGAVILGGLDGVRSRSVTGTAPGADRVEWRPGDPDRERTDIASYLRSWTLRDTNFTEWYFPLRLVLDMSLLDSSLEETPGFLPNRLVTVPTLALGAGRGLVSDLSYMRGYANVRYGSPITAYVLPGLTHIDIVSARSNPVVPIVQRWTSFFASQGK